MSPVTVTSVVARPAPEVFAYVTDPTRFSQWQQGVIDGHLEGQSAPVTETSARVTIAVDFAGHGIGRVLVPLVVRRPARKEMPANMAALKERVEALDQPRPA